jgi:asparagine synthase (glutamine-hydrolysing)
MDYLPNDILTKVDRMTMAHGLEARAPLLIPDVAEYALGLPAHLKLTAFGHPKRILRELVKQRLGPEVSQAKKQGFSIPVHRWLRGPLRPTLESLVNRRMLDDLGVLNTDAILREKDRHLSGKAQLGWELWGIMVLVEWYQQRMKSSLLGAAAAKSLKRVTFPTLAERRTSSTESQ